MVQWDDAILTKGKRSTRISRSCIEDVLRCDCETSSVPGVCRPMMSWEAYELGET